METRDERAAVDRRTTDGGRQSRRTRKCGWPMPAAAEMLERLHGRCGRPSRDAGAAPQKGRLAGGLELSSRGAAKRSSRSTHRLLSLPLPALAVNASRGRFLARRAYLGHSSRARGGRAVDFPRAAVIFAPFPCGAEARLISRGRAVDFAPFPR